MENAPRWLREKVELSDAMSEAPSRPHGTKADMVPAAELMGVYIAYATVSLSVVDALLSRCGQFNICGLSGIEARTRGQDFAGRCCLLQRCSGVPDIQHHPPLHPRKPVAG